MDKPIDEMSDMEIQRAIAELRHGAENVVIISGRVFVQHLYDDYPKECANWPQDTHAAVIDLLAEMEGYMLVKDNESWLVSHIISPTILSGHDHPARAISMAWLAWKRGNDGR